MAGKNLIFPLVFIGFSFLIFMIISISFMCYGGLSDLEDYSRECGWRAIALMGHNFYRFCWKKILKSDSQSIFFNQNPFPLLLSLRNFTEKFFKSTNTPEKYASKTTLKLNDYQRWLQYVDDTIFYTIIAFVYWIRTVFGLWISDNLEIKLKSSKLKL